MPNYQDPKNNPKRLVLIHGFKENRNLTYEYISVAAYENLCRSEGVAPNALVLRAAKELDEKAAKAKSK